MSVGFLLSAVSFLEPTIVPRPVELTFASDREVVLEKIEVDCPHDASAVLWVAEKAAMWFGPLAVVAAGSGKAVDEGDEAYELTAVGLKARIRANALPGVRHAMHLRQAGWDVPMSSREQTGFVTDDIPLRTTPER